jgi:hypothetical protein
MQGLPLFVKLYVIFVLSDGVMLCGFAEDESEPVHWENNLIEKKIKIRKYFFISLLL